MELSRYVARSLSIGAAMAMALTFSATPAHALNRVPDNQCGGEYFTIYYTGRICYANAGKTDIKPEVRSVYYVNPGNNTGGIGFTENGQKYGAIFDVKYQGGSFDNASVWFIQIYEQ